MAKGDTEYRRLTDAMNDHMPPCSGYPRFILDRHEIAPDELSHISLTICRTCPIKQPCRAYGEAARPGAGIWAGRTWGTPRKESAA